MCGCAKPSIPPGEIPDSLLTASGNFDLSSIIKVIDPATKQQMVMLEYVGPNTSPFTVNSRSAPNVAYRFANAEHHRVKAVLIGDVPFLLSLNTRGEKDFRPVQNMAVPDTHDPVEFLGHPISA